MKELELISNHVAQAKARLLQQYKGKARVEGLIEALVFPLQGLEIAFFQLLNERHLNTAEGVQLDRLGGIVGISRGGLSDEAYRLRIRARVLVNISDGDPETLILIFKLLTQANLVIFQEWTGGVSFFSDGFLASAADALAVHELMEAAALAGVRVDAVGYFDSANPFALDGTVLPYGDGLGSIYNPSAGGKLAGLYVVGKEFALAGNDSNVAGLSSIYDPRVGGRLVGL